MEFVGKVLYYTIFYGVLFVIALSYLGKRDGEKEMLGRQSGRELKGIAILMVLLGHLAYMMGYVKLPVTPALGAPAVDIFLFLSAFGLMSSYQAKGLKGFAKRRLGVIMIPYVITTLFKFAVPMGRELGVKTVLVNLVPISTNVMDMVDTSMWYIQYILLCYLVFFLVFSLPKPGMKGKTLLLFLVGAALAVWNGSLYYKEAMPYMSSLSESYSHHLSFPLGAAFFLIYEKAKKLSYKVYIPIALAAFIIFQFIAYPGVDGYVKYYINNLCYVIFFVAVFAVIKHFGLRSGFLNWMGELSYYIYLNELVVISIFYQFVPLPSGINGLLVILTSVAAAVPVKIFCEWILKKLKVH